MSGPSEIELAEWRGALGEKLDTIRNDLQAARAELAEIRGGKEKAHSQLYDRIREVERGAELRIDALESRWDRAIGAAIGIGIGAGAVGGGVGALVSSLIGG